MIRISKYEKLPDKVEEAAKYAVDSAFTVHKKLGPGMLERVYERFLIIELRKRGLKVESQVKIPILYDGVEYDEYFVLDLLVEDCLILELKNVELIQPIHKAQLLTYLRLSKNRLGLLINFNSINIGDGISRMIN